MLLMSSRFMLCFDVAALEAYINSTLTPNVELPKTEGTLPTSYSADRAVHNIK